MGCKRVPTVLQVGVGQLAVDAVYESAEFAGIGQEGLLAAVAECGAALWAALFG